jgi:hypothetical protein
MEEIWKDIPDYEGLYQVSNLGRVKSLPKEWKTGKRTIRKHNGIILKQRKSPLGYYDVSLYKNSIMKTRSVHQLVAIAFLGHNPNGVKLVVDHINDNPSDNRVENLQIVTQRFNSFKTQGKYSSQYKGVCMNKITKKWISRIRINGKLKHLGYFDCELKAHLAYEDALKNLEQTQPF